MLIQASSDNYIEVCAEDFKEVLRLALCTGLPLDPKKLRRIRHAFVTFIVEDIDNVHVAAYTTDYQPGRQLDAFSED